MKKRQKLVEHVVLFIYSLDEISLKKALLTRLLIHIALISPLFFIHCIRKYIPTFVFLTI